MHISSVLASHLAYFCFLYFYFYIYNFLINLFINCLRIVSYEVRKGSKERKEGEKESKNGSQYSELGRVRLSGFSLDLTNDVRFLLHPISK